MLSIGNVMRTLGRWRWTCVTGICAVLPAIAIAQATRPEQTSGVTTASAPASSTAPAEQVPEDALTTPGTDRVELSIPGKNEPAVLWVSRPAGYGPGQMPPLLVCLHGTDDTAEQMVAFWRDRRSRIAPVIAAPQGIGKGWSSEDVATIRAAFDWLNGHVWYDRHRVALAGWSAGGAMTFQMIYKENVPVTAAMALANYVPPRLAEEDIRSRRELPVFYAVGMADVNHELMRAGLEYVRAAGANVELYHPTIGHVLSPEVAQAAVNWFQDLCDRQTRELIDKAAGTSEVARTAERLEQIATQPRWFDPQQVAQAAQVLAELEKPGEASLRQAEQLIAGGQPAQAVETLSEVERTYGLSRLGVAARRRHEKFESDPAVRQQIQDAQRRKRTSDGFAEYARAQKLVAQNRLADAAEACRRVINVYGDTPAAERARNLLRLLEGRTSSP